MFVPHELEVEGRPELRRFPANVLFAKVSTRDGVPILGSALYEPDLSSFESSGTRSLLRYKNLHGGNCWLRIAYDSEQETWEGEKIIDGEMVGSASGPGWQGFFAHLTLLGLANGERCHMERLVSPDLDT